MAKQTKKLLEARNLLKRYGYKIRKLRNQDVFSVDYGAGKMVMSGDEIVNMASGYKKPTFGIVERT